MLIPQERLRQLTLALGASMVGFGIVPYLAPRCFARLFGLGANHQPVADVLIRSISARDAISGIGILSATIHGGRVAPWLLARLLADASDVVAISLAVSRGARAARLLALGGLALLATVVDLLLYVSYRSMARMPRSVRDSAG